MRCCTTHALYRSKLWQQDPCQHPQNANPDSSMLEGTAQHIGWPFGGGGVEAQGWGHHQEDPDQVHRKGPGNHWWNSPAVWWSLGAIRWPVPDPECGSRTRRRPTSLKRPRFGFRRSATTLYPPPPTWTCWTTSFGHTSRTSPPTTPKPAWSPPSTGACGKGMLPVPDLYQGGDWGWRRLHWIDVSSTI